MRGPIAEAVLKWRQRARSAPMVSAGSDLSPVDYREMRVTPRELWAFLDLVEEAWATDMTDDEVGRLAEAIRRADHRNWDAAELAALIAGTVRAIAAGRLA